MVRMDRFCLAAAMVALAAAVVPPNATADTHYPAEEPTQHAYAVAK
jgi:hypothetical protein